MAHYSNVHVRSMHCLIVSVLTFQLELKKKGKLKSVLDKCSATGQTQARQYLKLRVPTVFNRQHVTHPQQGYKFDVCSWNISKFRYQSLIAIVSGLNILSRLFSNQSVQNENILTLQLYFQQPGRQYDSGLKIVYSLKFKIKKY